MLQKAVHKFQYKSNPEKLLLLLQSKWGLALSSVVLGLLASLGFAPFYQWVVLLISLSFEFFLISSSTSKKQIFMALLLYFTAMNAVTLEWLNFVMTGFGALPLLVSWAIEILFSAYLALFHALLGTAAFRLALRKIRQNNTVPTASAAAAAATTATAADVASTAIPDPALLTQTSSRKAAADGTDDSAAAGTDAYDDDGDVEELPERGVSALSGNGQNHELSGGAMPGMVPAAKLGQNRAMPEFVCNKLGQVRFHKNAFLLCMLPVALILADFIIGILFSGFPWMYVGYSTIDSPFAAYAPFFGVRGVSLVLFVCAGALALTIERCYVYMPVAGLLFLLALFTQGIKFTKDLDPITVAGIQGNIPQAIKWDPRQTMPTIDKYLNLTLPQFGHNDLIIWPESAMPVLIHQVMPLIYDLNRYAYNHATPILIGIQRAVSKHETYNSLYLLGQEPDVASAQHYDKRKLVPFGEVVPFEKFTRQLGSIFNFPMSSFTPGALDQEQMKLILPHDMASAAIKARSNNQSHNIILQQDDNDIDTGTTAVSESGDTTEVTAEIKDDVATNSADASSIDVDATANSEGTADTNVDADVACHDSTVTVVPAAGADSDTAAVGSSNNTEKVSDAEAQEAADELTKAQDTKKSAEAARLAETKVAVNDPDSSETSEENEPESDPGSAVVAKESAHNTRELGFLPAICYESIFPEMMRTMVTADTHGIIMVSNDSWYGDTRGPEEHLAIARMRSLELQKPMIRVTNSGITAFIDADGQVLKQLPRNVDGVMQVTLTPNEGLTLWARYGNLPLMVLLLLLSTVGFMMCRREPDPAQQQLSELIRP